MDVVIDIGTQLCSDHDCQQFIYFYFFFPQFKTSSNSIKSEAHGNTVLQRPSFSVPPIEIPLLEFFFRISPQNEDNHEMLFKLDIIVVVVFNIFSLHLFIFLLPPDSISFATFGWELYSTSTFLITFL